MFANVTGPHSLNMTKEMEALNEAMRGLNADLETAFESHAPRGMAPGLEHIFQFFKSCHVVSLFVARVDLAVFLLQALRKSFYSDKR